MGFDSKVFYKMLNFDSGIEKTCDEILVICLKIFFLLIQEIFSKCVNKDNGKMNILKKYHKNY